MFREKLILLLAFTTSVSLQAIGWLSSEPEYSKKNIIKAIEEHRPNKLTRLLKKTDNNEFSEYDLQNALNLARKISLELEIQFGYWDYTKLTTSTIVLTTALGAILLSPPVISQILGFGIFMSSLCAVIAHDYKIPLIIPVLGLSSSMLLIQMLIDKCAIGTIIAGIAISWIALLPGYFCVQAALNIYQSLKKYRQYKIYKRAKTVLNILENHTIGICLELQLPTLALSNN